MTGSGYLAIGLIMPTGGCSRAETLGSAVIITRMNREVSIQTTCTDAFVKMFNAHSFTNIKTI